MKKRHLHSSRAVTDSGVVRLGSLCHDGSAWNDLTPHGYSGEDHTGGGWPFFDGVGDYVVAPGPYSQGGIGGVLPISQDLATATVEAWFKPAAIGSNMRIVSIHSASSLNSLSVGVRAAGDLFFQVQNSSRGDSLSTMVAGDWAHVACTVGPGVAPIVYINGADDTNTSSTSWPPSSTYQIGIGVTLYGGGPFLSQPFHGDIDTVRVYDRILSPDEVLKNYNAGRAAHP